MAHDPMSHYLQGVTDAEERHRLKIVRTGCLTVELSAQRVRVEERIIEVPGREWGILAYLAERLGAWCPTDDIVASVWGKEWLTMSPYGLRGARTPVCLVRVTTGRLKQRLGPAGTLISSSRERGLFGSGRRLERVPCVGEEQHEAYAQPVVSETRERHDSAGPALVPHWKEAWGTVPHVPYTPRCPCIQCVQARADEETQRTYAASH
jgi:hypothetical protein